MTLEEFLEWKQHPATDRFFKFLSRTRENIKEEWANSMYTGAETDETLQRNASALGQVQLLKLLDEVSFDEIEETLGEQR